MSENKTSKKKKTILVVDDVELNQSIVNKIFGESYVVLRAQNGSHALQILYQWDVDIVLLDIQMPIMDGYEVIKAMKADLKLSEIPILVTTAAVDQSERKALKLGADDFLTQPYDPYIIKKRVDNLVERYQLKTMRHALNEQKKEENLLKGLGIAYWEWTDNGGYYHSQEYEKYAISEMPNEKIWDSEAPYVYVHPDDVPLMRRFMEKYADDKIKKSAVVRCRMRDGSYKWTEMFSFAEVTIDGRLKRLVSAMRDVDKEWNASHRVEKKNKELNNIIDSISGGIATYLVNDGLLLQSMTDSLAKRLGYTQEQLNLIINNVDATNYVHPSDRVLIRRKADEVIKTGSPQVLAYRIVKHDHTYAWYRGTLYPAGEVDGYPLVYEVLTDIQEVNADYEEALNQTDEMVVIADWESRDILYLNQAAANVSGRTISELFGEKCSQIAQHCDERCAYCFKDELTYEELTIKPVELGKRVFRTKGKRVMWNGREAFVEYVADITAQQRMTEKAVFERNLLTAATKVLFPMCIISNLTQNEYKIIEYESFRTQQAANDGQYEKLMDIAASSVPKDDREIVKSTFSRQNLIKAHANGEKIVSLIHRRYGDDGTIHWNRTIVVFADQLFDGDLFTITFVDNVDEDKKNEGMLKTALKEAEYANAAKTAFLSRISHDMRTPLNGILGLTNIMKDRVTDEKNSQDLDELQLSGNYLLNLINDTLDVSRIENGKLELNPSVYDGRSLFNNALSLIKTNAAIKNIQVNLLADSIPLTMLYVDGGRIEQIAMNVAGNAIKFSPENGKIDITLKNMGVKNGMITEMLQVRDYGTGMSQDFLPHLFEPFSQEDTARTNSNQGTGLGMAITHQLVHLMGGNITVESELGKGSCFTLELKLPLATEEQIENWKRGQIRVDDGVRLNDKMILLCEDHPLNTKITTKVLENKGIHVDHAENGQIGVDKFVRSAIGYYDAVLMDIRMPVMDGIDATRAIRRLSRQDARSIPIIAMTANAFAEDIKQTQRAGMSAHLSKPIQTEVLYNTLSELINGKYEVPKRKVLVVDDVEINRDVITATLKNDYDLYEAHDGEEALKILQEVQGMDVVITDIQMPGMDGVELIRKIRSDPNNSHMVIIVNTQFGDPEQEENLLSIGANEFVYKATTPKIIEMRIRNALKLI